MSTGLIIAIIVVAIIVIALVVMLPRMRRKAEMQKRERELGRRRETASMEHREVANERELEAEEAERRAAMAQKEAERQRADAGIHAERAEMHERGDADHELIEEDERDRFAGTSADRGGRLGDEPRGETTDEAGRDGRDGRFTRDERTADAPTEEPTRRA